MKVLTKDTMLKFLYTPLCQIILISLLFTEETMKTKQQIQHHPFSQD